MPGPNTTQLTASALPAPITATTPWFSLNPAVATISSSGLVTAVSFGVTTISYTDNLGSVYSENVYVSTFPTITASNGTSTCANGGTLQVEGSLFPNVNTPWESLNPSIATIDNTGLITGVSAGVVNILYRNLGGCTTTIPITINPLLFPTIVCGVSTPTSRTFNWNAVLGAQTYVVLYSINGGPTLSGSSGPSLTFTLNGIIQSDNVTLFVIPSGPRGSCFQAGTLTCAGTPCPNAGNDGLATICDSNTTPSNLFSLIAGEDLGGTWTRTSGTGGTFNASAGTFTPATGATSSSFTYLIVGSNGCANDTSIATINVVPAPNAGVDGATTICNSSAAVINLFSLITGEQTGGTWTRTSGTGGTFNASAGTFTPATGATSSTFNYTLIATAPCLNDSSVATININSQPNAGVDGSIIICDTSTIVINLFSLITGEETGGIWTRTSGTGGIFNASAGTYTPATGATSSTFAYTLNAAAPCLNDSSVATININSQPNAGVDGSTTICESSATTINLFSLITGEQAGGTWTRTSGTGGTFNALAGTFISVTGATSSSFLYTIIPTTTCLSDSSVATININSQPNAGVDGSITICDSSTSVINLFSLITGGQTGGTWTRTSGTGGTFNALAGTFTPAPGATSSIFSYTILGTTPCINDASSVAININPQPSAAILSGNQSICVGLTTTFSATVLGGSWSSSNTAIATVNSVTGVITGVTAGVATISYTLVASTPCVNSVYTRTITVFGSVQPTIDGFQGVCVGSNTVFSATPPGGTWSSSDNSVATVDATGFILGNASGTAIITYTVLGSGGCVTTSASRTVTVSTTPTLQLDSSPSTTFQSVCTNSPITPILYSVINFVAVDVSTVGLPLGVSGFLNLGTYSISGTPLVSGTFQYTIIAAGPCGGVSLSGTIVVIPNSSLFLISEPYTTNQSICLNSPITPINYFASNGVTGATVVGLPDGITGSFNLGNFTISGTSTTLEGVFPYTITTSGGCGVDTLSGTITVSEHVSTTFFCDQTLASSLNSVFIYWNDISGCTNYEFAYSINDGPLISDSTAVPYYEIFDVLPGQSVLFTITNAVGVSCFQSTSTTCTNLANESFESEVFQSFPNPIDDILNLKSRQPIKNIQIYNLVGQQVFTNDYNEKEFQINLSHLSSGSYLVKAYTEDSIKTFKILKN